ncbi:hypothetical protein FQN49_001101 [Arthroderma sp. PD_2]|nr:hypothetical protein FQN49_001101 [Arthroderma sp. PD_2]
MAIKSLDIKVDFPAIYQTIQLLTTRNFGQCNFGMGWVGVGALIASITYILYKHPPTSWTFLLSPWSHLAGRRIAPNAANSDPGSTTVPPKDGQRDAKPEKNDSTVLATASNRRHSDGETTPKAMPSIPASDIPPITLEEPLVTIKDAEEAATLPPGAAIGPNTQTEYVTPPDIRVPPPPSMALDPPPQAVRAQGRLSTPASTSLMPPPPPPLARPSPRAPLRPPPSAAASLRVPPGSRPSSSTLPVLPAPGKPQRTARPVMLEPGHSPLDWAALTSDPRNNLRGADLPPTLIRVTPSVLKQYNGRKGRDAWTSYQGKVYNITAFVPFHPGGKGELLRGAGKDSEKLFAEFHPWVNWDGMLAECMVGILVAEHSVGDHKQGGGLDEMD